jgi:predicted transposase YbfD/YdcC
VVRAHWSIENSQHWVLDVQYREDQNRTRKDNAAANFAIIRRMSLNMARRNSNDKLSISKRKLRASLDDSFRTQLLFGT